MAGFTTPNLGLSVWPSGAMEPDIPVNATFQRLDTLVRPGGIVQDVGTTTPPSVVSGDIGKSWVVGTGATGGWAGHDDDIALLVEVDLWAFMTPNDMWRVGNIADETDYVFNGSSGWTAVTGGSGSGDVVGPASSTDNTLVRMDGTTGKVVQGSGVTLSDNNEISGYRGNINFQTGTTYTVQVSDSGKVIDHANGSAITTTLPNNLPVGWCCTYAQTGAGQVTFSAASGATLRNRSSHTKVAGQWGLVTLEVRANSGGSAAEYVLAGDTAT